MGFCLHCARAHMRAGANSRKHATPFKTRAASVRAAHAHAQNYDVRLSDCAIIRARARATGPTRRPKALISTRAQFIYSLCARTCRASRHQAHSESHSAEVDTRRRQLRARAFITLMNSKSAPRARALFSAHPLRAALSCRPPTSAKAPPLDARLAVFCAPTLIN